MPVDHSRAAVGRALATCLLAALLLLSLLGLGAAELDGAAAVAAASDAPSHPDVAQGPAPPLVMEPGEEPLQPASKSVWVVWLLNFVDWIISYGVMGMVVYVFFFAAVVVFGLPVTVVETIPGFLFGWEWGFVVAFAGKNLGNAISIALGKTCFRNYIQTKIAPKYRTLRVVQKFARTNGIVAIMIFRVLVFSPLALKNYGLALCDIEASHILIAAMITGAPFAVWWTYLGSTAKNLVQILDGQDIESPFAVMRQRSDMLAIVALPTILLWYYVITAAKTKWKAADLALEAEEEAIKLKQDEADRLANKNKEPKPADIRDLDKPHIG